MTFMLLQLTSEDALSRLQPFVALPEGYLGERKGFVGVYAFAELESGTVKTRMFDGTMEDPATGSAASALAGWLAKSKGQGEWIVDIIQGADMGRKSEISVRVAVGDGEVKRITLEGKAVVIMEGSLYI
jgi:PhzF family phenazine biosynthesis protein